MSRSALRRKRPAILVLLAVVTLLAGLALHWLPQIGAQLDQVILSASQAYAERFEAWGAPPPFLIPLAAFAGGQLASVSPCVLAMLPLNLSYIGTLGPLSRRQAFVRVAGFVAGTVVVLSLFGLVASFAAAVVVDHRGPVHLGVGLLILVMGLNLAGWLPLRLPRLPELPPAGGPFLVGMGFALVSSPCASPVLFSVLAAAAGTGSVLLSVVTMVSYALGYTAVIAATSLWAGLLGTSRLLLRHGSTLSRVSALVLLAAGGFYVVQGLIWSWPSR
ncbi:cytochrome c biogenesis protein CcdA [Synechococcus sp. CS-1324]|uniref:cytochrome c biogenesis protein CcdA n=1 Tax=Synechococcus sp. CS-1324 TaxID=2847980 RepID=UPI000DAFF417|nr:cytochrome c biogenesis protein CcdA [Synechococcus sp. CS-1324]MCT0230159.1 cytochrome c biogenesis protein CcdA [Synechococcus sp. CS-1324]PZV01521.1 MAG: cytochrome C biogenesis protein CcdA [Cyanobium sp.]